MASAALQPFHSGYFSPVPELDHKLPIGFTPVTVRHGPFLYDVCRTQVQCLAQRIIIWEYGFILSDFSQLPVEALDCVCSVYKPAYPVPVTEILT